MGVLVFPKPFLYKSSSCTATDIIQSIIKNQLLIFLWEYFRSRHYGSGAVHRSKAKIFHIIHFSVDFCIIYDILNFKDNSLRHPIFGSFEMAKRLQFINSSIAIYPFFYLWTFWPFSIFTFGKRSAKIILAHLCCKDASLYKSHQRKEL